MNLSVQPHHSGWDLFDVPFLAVYESADDTEPIADLLEIASRYRVVPIQLGRKGPRTPGWGGRVFTEAEIEVALQRNNHLGILLGPVNGIIDIEGDGPDADHVLAELFAGVKMPDTPTWQSERGTHRLFQLPDEVAQVNKSKFYADANKQLEVRTGVSAVQQSVLPHPENGRKWIGRPLSAEFQPAKLPQVVVDGLVAAANAKPQDESKVKDQVAKVVEWAEANGFQPGSVNVKDTFTVVNVQVCPFKGQDDGNAGLLVDHETGHVRFKCHHAKCDGKSLADLEAIAKVPFTGRRSIIVGPPEHVMVDQASASLRDAPGVYQRGTDLVQIVSSSFAPEGIVRAVDVPTIQIIATAALQEILSRLAEWWQQSRRSLVRTYVPGVVVKLLDVRNSYPVPPLIAIVSSPVLRPDGTILSTPGYDASTGLYLSTEVVLPELSVAEAKAAIDYLLIDFPFATESDKSALIAGLLTPLARQAFSGSTPLFLVEANVPGAGKSLAADVIGFIVSGREMSRMTAPDGDEEWRKRITSIVMGGEQLILIDNVATTLGSPSLDAMLTGTTWSDRILGKSETVTAPIVHTTFATANNVVVGGDLVRRTLPIRLQSPLENPEKRDDFREPDLLAYVRTNRAKLLTAALTILRHYFAAGRPKLGLPAWGSYEGWSSVVRSAVVFAGYPDPVATRDRFAEQADSSAELLRLLIRGWKDLDPQGRGLSSREAYNRRTESAAMLDAIDSLPPSKDPKHQLGVTLGRYRGRVIDGQSFVSESTRDSNLWRVQHN